ncbi:MAG: zinc ribbon domain-containing protein [Nanoarchaeota archaeon]
MSKKEKTTSWSWKMSPEERKEQIESYNTLKITQSYRGVSVLIVGALLLFSLAMAFFGVYSTPEDVILSMFIYVPILFFVYKGHRWAIISLLILWTVEKVYALYLSAESGGGIIAPIIWWLIVSPYIFKALIVENERRAGNVQHVVVEGAYCPKCGTRQEKDAKFCIKCGTEVDNP